jgi:hypothetical protein
LTIAEAKVPFSFQKIGLDWIDEKNKIMTSYSTTRRTLVFWICIRYVQTGFRSFSKGLDDFNQLNSSSAILNYTPMVVMGQVFLQTPLLYSK